MRWEQRNESEDLSCRRPMDMPRPNHSVFGVWGLEVITVRLHLGWGKGMVWRDSPEILKWSVGG